MATLTPVTSLEVILRTVRPVVSAVVAVGTVAGALLLAATPAAAGPVTPGFSQPGPGLSAVETLLLYVAAPGAIFVLIALVVVGPSLGKGPRHRTGASLETGPVWIDSAGGQHARAGTATPDRSSTTDQGGASAHW